MLADWSNPPGRDQVMGLWRPIPAAAGQPAAMAVWPKLATLFKASSTSVRNAAVLATAALRIKEAGAIDRSAGRRSAQQPDRFRAAASKALDELEDPRSSRHGPGRAPFARIA